MLTARIAGAPRAQPQRAPQPQPEPAAEGEEEDGSELSAEDGTADGEDADDLDMPETLEGLAEALEIPVAKLQEIKVPRKVDGKVEHVTLAEAIEQHQLHADYQRKTRSLSEERKAVEAERSQYRQVVESKVRDLDHAIAASVAFLQQSGLSDESIRLIEQQQGFEAALKAERHRDRMVSQINAAIRHRDALAEQQAVEAKQAANVYRGEQQQALFDARPGLREPRKMLEFESDLIGYLEGNGHSREEVMTWMTGPWDHRQVLMVEKAMKYDRLVAEGKKKGVVGSDKRGLALKPGAAQPAEKVRTFESLKKNLRRASASGSRNDAISAAAQLLNAQMRGRKR